MIETALVPPVDVVGVSSGGTVALQLAADHPNLLRRSCSDSDSCSAAIRPGQQRIEPPPELDGVRLRVEQALELIAADEVHQGPCGLDGPRPAGDLEVAGDGGDPACLPGAHK
jgi:pimeloyl-ACP methyl ester carboxylesterase